MSIDTSTTGKRLETESTDLSANLLGARNSQRQEIFRSETVKEILLKRVLIKAKRWLCNGMGLERVSNVLIRRINVGAFFFYY